MLSGKHSVDIFTEDAVEYIEKQKEAGKPFFLSVAYMSPHDPRTMPDEYMRQYDFDKIQLPPNYMDKHPFDNGELVIRDEVLAAIPPCAGRNQETYHGILRHGHPCGPPCGRYRESLKRNGRI